MNITKLQKYAHPMDIILIGGGNLLSFLICNGQRPQTVDGKPSLWSHSMFYWSEDTVIESTMDFTPYPVRKLDNGVQFNYLENYADSPRGMLLHFYWTDVQRDILMIRADKLRMQGITYPLLGLVGSLLSYWVFPWKSNPLQSKHSLYCSAFVQEVYGAMGIDFDTKHTARNTSPEKISQFWMQGLRRYDLSEVK